MLDWAHAESKVTGSWIVSSGCFAEDLIEDNGKDPFILVSWKLRLWMASRPPIVI